MRHNALMDDLAAFAEVARTRRTNLRVDPARSVPVDLIEQLIRLAQWAPNHKRTWPWRFAVLQGTSRAELGEALSAFQAARGDDEAKVAKARTKFLRAPALLAVASAAEPDPLRRAENRDAVAAGVQNVLLGAAAAGLAGYWGTGAVVEAPAVKELCGFGLDDDLVAMIYLGWPLDGGPIAPDRPEPQVRWLG